MLVEKTIQNLLIQLLAVRKQTEFICQPLAIEDYVIQTMPDVSPAKWHLAHVSWFFEIFILVPYLKNYRVFHPDYHFLFNSYYESLGSFYPRTQRGWLARPTVEEVYQYRHYVDQHLQKLIAEIDEPLAADVMFALQLGIHHEQQHQELLLMDIKYNFAHNPLHPVYVNKSHVTTSAVKVKSDWLSYEGGLQKIGYTGNDFSFDNEKPQHLVYLAPFQIANQLVSNAEYLEFIVAGGYKKPQYWLSDGWQQVLKNNWQAPLYWENQNGVWSNMTLHGMCPVDLQQPVCHISYYEANAYANWAEARLPTEAEWEIAAREFAIKGNFLEQGNFHPQVAENNEMQFYGDVWEWTQSPYLPYPGFVPFHASFSEYNGKFTCNQFVLRGGCAVTPESHLRSTYRNFYYPHQRWPFTGIRLATDIV